MDYWLSQNIKIDGDKSDVDISDYVDEMDDKDYIKLYKHLKSKKLIK